MATKLHIAILVADAVIQAYEDQGGYVKLYSELSHRGADRYAEQHGGQRPELEFSVYNVWDKMQFPASLDGIDCVLISGSRMFSFLFFLLFSSLSTLLFLLFSSPTW